MSMSDDERPKRRPAPSAGDDLSLLSVEEIEARIALFRAEIERLEAELDRKRRSLKAADAVFRRP
jgi:uncharacterized small protein (DUF1192 family)